MVGSPFHFAGTTQATPHASAPRIHPCRFQPMARFSATSGARMAITSARRTWSRRSRRRSRIEPQYRSRARRRSSGPCPFQVAAASTRSHAVRSRNPRRPKGPRRVPAATRHLTVGERGGARLGEPDVRISAEPEVPALAVDGQPLHPVAAPAAGLDDEVEGAAVAVAARPQGWDLLVSEPSCHRDFRPAATRVAKRVPPPRILRSTKPEAPTPATRLQRARRPEGIAGASPGTGEPDSLGIGPGEQTGDLSSRPRGPPFVVVRFGRIAGFPLGVSHLPRARVYYPA